MLIFLVSAKPNSRRPPLLPLATARRLAASYKVPYTLPSSVSSNPFVCRSYKDCRGVHRFFPFWNASVPKSGLQCPPISDQSSPRWYSFTGHGARVALHESLSSAFLCFHALTNCKFHNSFVLRFIQISRGVSSLKAIPNLSSQICDSVRSPRTIFVVSKPHGSDPR
jgi:hypothetical protein